MVKLDELDAAEQGTLVRYYSVADSLDEDRNYSECVDEPLVVNCTIERIKEQRQQLGCTDLVPVCELPKNDNLPVAPHASPALEQRLYEPSHPSLLEEQRSDGDKLSSELSNFVQKKSIAQGMMDLALVSANTNQLRYVVDLGYNHPYYYTSLFLILTSLVMQVIVGLTMLYVSRFNIRNKREIKAAQHVNNLSVVGVFLITLINVFISTFNGSNSVTYLKSDEGTADSTDATTNIPEDLLRI